MSEVIGRRVRSNTIETLAQLDAWLKFEGLTLRLARFSSGARSNQAIIKRVGSRRALGRTVAGFGSSLRAALLDALVKWHTAEVLEKKCAA